jgi:AraC family transcriptional regulator
VSHTCPGVTGTVTGSVEAMNPPAVADYPRGARMALRVIDDYEFVWMLRGQARLVTAEHAVLLTPGELLLIPAGRRHGFEWDEHRPSRHGYVHFRPGACTAPARAQPQVRPMTHHDPLAGLCAYLLWVGNEQPPGWQRSATDTLQYLLQLFTSAPLPPNQARTSLPTALLSVVNHLRTQWSRMPLRRISVDELATVACLSRSQLNRLFHAQFGLSTSAALELLRCSRAETLLTRTDLTLGEIAHHCGFADLYHFSHRFTRLYGLPPSHYRNAATQTPLALDTPGVRRLASAIWEQRSIPSPDPQPDLHATET